MWDKSQHDPHQGRVKMLLCFGGAWQAIVPAIRQIADPYDAVLVFDVAGEIRQMGFDQGTPGYHAISPRQQDQIGVLVDALDETDHPEAKLVAERLRGQEGDPERGMGQVPGLGWMALTRELDEVHRTYQDLFGYLRTLCSGTIRSCDVHVFRGTGGGSGRGAGRLLMKELRDAFATYAPGATLSIRHFTADGAAWIGCGLRVERNGATGAANIYADAVSDPYRKPTENQRWNLCTFPAVGTDKVLRDRLALETAAMLLSPKFYDEMERTGSNENVQPGRRGNIYIYQFSHFGAVKVEDLMAAVAVGYISPLQELTNGNLTASSSAIRRIFARSELLDSPRREIDQILEDARTTRGGDGRFLEELLGVGAFNASAATVIEMTDGVDVQAEEMLDALRSNAADVRRFIVDAHILSDRLSSEIQSAQSAEIVARRKLKNAEDVVHSHWRFIFGSFVDQALSPRSWSLWIEGSKARLRKLRMAAERARKLNEEYTHTHERVEALKRFRDLLARKLGDQIDHIRTAIAVLNRYVQLGTAPEGIRLRPIDEVLMDLLVSASMGNKKLIEHTLLSAVESVSIDLLARQIFKYYLRQPADAGTLARLLDEGTPLFLGTSWGQVDRTKAEHRQFIFLPLSAHDLRDVKESFAILDRRTVLMPIGCGAGAFVGGGMVFYAHDEEDVVTPFYQMLLTEMAKDATDLALSLVPGEPLLPDPRPVAEQSRRRSARR